MHTNSGDGEGLPPEAFRSAVDAAMDGMAILDHEERFAYLNDAHAEIYGYEPGELLGRRWQCLYEGAELERFESEVMPELYETGRWHGEAVGVRKDGSTFPQELSLSLCHEGRILCVVRDVTDRRERERELEATVERLERFASVLSHDLRNPLEIAQGYLPVARETGDPEYFDEVADALDRIDSLVSDLLVLARNGDAADTRRELAVGDAARRAWATVPAGGVDAELVAAEDPEFTVEADPQRLGQLFENLFRNSVEHGATGPRSSTGDSVEHGATGPRSGATGDSVEHGATDDGGGATGDGTGTDADAPSVTVSVGPVAPGRPPSERPEGFHVADDGPGIPAERRAELFETGVSGSGGTGLGLAIVERVVEAHGWALAVGESPAGGACFEVLTDPDPGAEGTVRPAGGCRCGRFPAVDPAGAAADADADADD